MSEAEYMALHQHPSPEFIAENLKQRMDAVQQFALNAAAREQLEAHLRRQNEASGGGHRSGGSAGSSGSAAGGNRTPKQLEFPIIPASLIFRGSTDTRQVSDWVREWDQLSLYVSPTFKVAHLLTAIAEPVKQTLNAAFRTTRYNGGLGYTSLTHVPFSEIILLMKEVYDRPDHIYKAILRWRDLRMQNENLEGFLRARDKMNNQLSAYGVMVDAQTSKYMLVGAVSETIRRDLMREKNWQDLTEEEMITSMKTKELAVITASSGAHHASKPSWHNQPAKHGMNSMQHLMVADAHVQHQQQAPRRTPPNMGGTVPRPSELRPRGVRARMRRSHASSAQLAYAQRRTPQEQFKRPQSAPQNRQYNGPNRGANTIQKGNYNLRGRTETRLGQRHMRNFYHPSEWNRRVDPQTNRLRHTAQPWKPENRNIYNKDVDQNGQKYCIYCQVAGHNLTTCAEAHKAWKQRRATAQGQ